MFSLHNIFCYRNLLLHTIEPYISSRYVLLRDKKVLMLCLQTEDNWSLYLDPIIDFSLHNRNNFTLFVNIFNRNKKNLSFLKYLFTVAFGNLDILRVICMIYVFRCVCTCVSVWVVYVCVCDNKNYIYNAINYSLGRKRNHSLFQNSVIYFATFSFF